MQMSFYICPCLTGTRPPRKDMGEILSTDLPVHHPSLPAPNQFIAETMGDSELIWGQGINLSAN
jgi:hypothetical protein